VDSEAWLEFGHHGSVALPPVVAPIIRSNSELAKALREFNEHVHHDERVDLSPIPIGEGLTLPRRRG
jgi:predicted O-methyltransferase YrrM